MSVCHAGKTGKPPRVGVQFAPSVWESLHGNWQDTTRRKSQHGVCGLLEEEVAPKQQRRTFVCSHTHVSAARSSKARAKRVDHDITTLGKPPPKHNSK